jgi:hypothetical protein
MTATLAAATVGTRVTIDGTVASFQNEIEISPATTVTATTTTPEALPAPVAATYAEVATGGTRAMTLEGVIVTLGASTVSAQNAPFGEFTVTAGTATLIVDDFLLPATNPALGKNFTALTGILATRQMVSKLEPRALTDLVDGAPAIAPFAVGPYFVRAVSSGVATFPTALVVTLTSPATVATTVTLTSSDLTKLTVVGGGVSFAIGEQTKQVALNALVAAPTVTLTASLAGSPDQTVTVRVLGAAENPTTVTLTPPTADIAPNGTVPYVVTLDLPAPAGGSMVAVSVTPPTAGTAPVTVMIPAGQLAAPFTYTDLGVATTATVKATFLASTSTSAVTVSTGASHLVINEVDYDQLNTDAAEYIEIYNPSSAPINLTGKSLVLINGADNTAYDTIDLGPAGILASHQYLVVAGAGVSVPGAALKLDPGWTTNAIQNGAPDGIALIDTTTTTLIDALSYEGAITMANLPGFAAATSLVEGTVLATAVADSNAVPATLCRMPNGSDTDNANVDWKVCSKVTPGDVNALN